MLATEPATQIVGHDQRIALTWAHRRIQELRQKYGSELRLMLTITAHIPARKMLNEAKPTE